MVAGGQSVQTRFQRLADAFQQSRFRLGSFRSHRTEAVKQLVGAHYSHEGAAADDRVPINFIELATNIYTRRLASNNPRAMVTALHPRHRPEAATLRLALNHLIEEIDLGASLRTIVIDALLGIGIGKLGLNRFDVEIEGFKHSVGQPFFLPVDLDDWVHDMYARRFDQCEFMGHIYTMATEDAREIFGDKEAIVPREPDDYNQGGDRRLDTISRGSYMPDALYRPQSRFVELWFPKENIIETYTLDEGEELGTRVGEMEWDGPENGPYHFLAFTPVPNNTMPLAPSMVWMDLHDLANRLFRKMARQAETQKDVLGVQAGHEEDADAITQAGDRETQILNNLQALQLFNFPGVDQGTLAFTVHCYDQFSRFAGNIDALGGLGPQADTATQDTMISQSASQRLADMGDQTVKFTRKVVRDLAWYLKHNPYLELPLTKKLPGTDIEIPVTFSADEQESQYFDHVYDIEPYSMQGHSPSQRVQMIRALLQEVFIPLQPIMQQQGVSLDFNALVHLLSEYLNVPEIEQILTTITPSIYEENLPDKPGKPAQTTRRYERFNRPGATTQGKDATLMQTLLGNAGNVQDSEMAALKRGFG